MYVVTTQHAATRSIILVLNASALSVCTPIDRTNQPEEQIWQPAVRPFIQTSGLLASTSGLFAMPRRSQSSPLTMVISDPQCLKQRRYGDGMQVYLKKWLISDS